MPVTPVRSWIIALVGGLFFFYNFFQMTVFNPLAPALMDAFNIDSVAFGAINSGFFLAVGLMALPAGMIADKIRTKPLLMALTLATVLNLVLISSIHDAALLGVLRFAQGMIHAFGLTLAMKLAIQWIAPKRLALASSLIVTTGLLGGALSQSLMTYFLKNTSLQQALLNDAYIGVGICLLFALVIRDNPTFWEMHKSPSWSDYFAGLRKSLLNPQTWLGGIYVLLLNLPLALLGATWGQLYMQNTWNTQPEMGSFIISLIFFGVIIGGPLVGMLSDALQSRKRPLIAGSVLSTLILGLALTTPSLSLAALGVLFFILGVTTSCQVLVYPMVAEANPPHVSGVSLSMVTFVIMIGNALANILFSTMVNNHALETALGPVYNAESFKPGMWMVWSALALSLLVIVLMRETFKRSTH
jgi:MFS family permease